ncbi:MAG: SixA phosphatase family protein [Planctomycetia bacterium]
MKLWLVRHAVALDAAEGRPDALRPVSDEGRARFARARRGLRVLGARFDEVRFSPLLRAQETADLLAPLCDGPLLVDGGLARAADEALLARIGGRSVALVGHEPHLSRLALWLVCGWEALDSREGLRLGKGGAMLLEGDPRPGAMQLVHLLQPRTLRKLGR